MVPASHLCPWDCLGAAMILSSHPPPGFNSKHSRVALALAASTTTSTTPIHDFYPSNSSSPSLAHYRPCLFTCPIAISCALCL
eukprot:c43449_g1_i1 orf=3-248(-)